MTNKAKLLELAARCEAATGPDRELDKAIRTATGLRLKVGLGGPTQSLDAAMTLVPEGFEWLVRDDERGGFANITSKDFQSIGTVSGNIWHDLSVGFSAPVWAATPALALCAAALRARAAMED